MKTERERNVRSEMAAFDLLLKFHKETECGEGGDHWAECEALVDSFGWISWEAWGRTVMLIAGA